MSLYSQSRAHRIASMCVAALLAANGAVLVTGLADAIETATPAHQARSIMIITKPDGSQVAVDPNTPEGWQAVADAKKDGNAVTEVAVPDDVVAASEDSNTQSSLTIPGINATDLQNLLLGKVDEIKTTVQTIVDDTGKTVVSVANSVVGTASSLVDGASSTVSSVVDDAGSTVSSVVGDVGKTVTTLQSTVTTIQNTVTTLPQTVTTLPQTVTTIPQTVSTAPQTVTSIVSSTPTTIQNTVTTVQSTVSSLVPALP
jgi:hypothetical protein